MALTKKLGKSRGSSGTHAHYAGEFGSSGKKLTKATDPSHRASRAEHYAKKAQSAMIAHATSTGSVRAQHALVVAHALRKASTHAKAAEKLAPGGVESGRAKIALGAAKLAHDSLSKKEPPITSTETRTVTAKIATKEAFSKTKIASDNPTPETQAAAAEAHRVAKLLNQGDPKTVALHEKQALHHQHRSEAMHLDGTKSKEKRELVDLGEREKQADGTEIHIRQNPIPYVPHKKSGKLVSETEEKVEISKLTSSQRRVALPGVEKFLKDPKAEASSVIPKITRHADGSYEIVEGNHRIAAAWLRGDTHIFAKIANVSEYKGKKKS